MGLRTEFQNTVSALVYSVIAERFESGQRRADREGGTGDDFPHNRVVRFLLDQHARMPDFLRLPFAAVTLAFDWSSLPRHGRRFHRLAPAARLGRVRAWRGSPVPACRDFIRFFDSLVALSWYSEVGASAPRDGAPPRVSGGRRSPAASPEPRGGLDP